MPISQTRKIVNCELIPSGTYLTSSSELASGLEVRVSLLSKFVPRVKDGNKMLKQLNAGESSNICYLIAGRPR